jgi:NADH dehydrogenase [ubiquinone] 1 alpha subcomplex assembly factor 1
MSPWAGPDAAPAATIDMRIVRLALASAMSVALVTSCTGDSTTADGPTTTVEPAPTSSSSTTSSVVTASVDDILVSFPDPASVAAWNNVDDSVMGGVSASTSEWQDGALVFSGLLSTANNGGFASIFGPVDRSIGVRAAGATALGIDAVADGRTYLLQLRAGASGNDRWISRFTPVTVGDRTLGTVVVPIAGFEAVDRFLRPINAPQPLDPTTIMQMGIYVLDGQVGEFRLALRAITAVR